DGAGGQGWVAVEEDGTPVPDGEWTAEKALTLQDTLTEQVLPMWRLPPPADACPATATRSLWFGLVPTYSDAHETAFDPALGVPTTPGAAHLDDRADYEIRCRALRPAARPDCPPEVYWSEATEPFRLAPFFDPEGTKNRTVSITMPDLGAVAARAGQPAGPGGLAVTTPAGSRLSFDPDDGTPTNPSPPGGAVARTCTFALELLMIVAFFVFSLFLPVVVLLFQLWWLLLLRFCLPASATSVAVLAAYFGNGGEIGDLPQRAPEPSPGQPRDADLEQLDALLGARGLGARLGTAGFDPPRAEALVHALDPAAAATPGRPPALSRPPDPLCEKDAPP
ncbi:hypothetical protein PU560_12470, partial [Georgenia sp. 10Sc9-8]|nr:hypothetical protein [Georgenia halotolerans]